MFLFATSVLLHLLTSGNINPQIYPHWNVYVCNLNNWWRITSSIQIDLNIQWSVYHNTIRIGWASLHSCIENPHEKMLQSAKKWATLERLSYKYQLLWNVMNRPAWERGKLSIFVLSYFDQIKKNYLIKDVQLMSYSPLTLHSKTHYV